MLLPSEIIDKILEYVNSTLYPQNHKILNLAIEFARNVKAFKYTSFCRQVSKSQVKNDMWMALGCAIMTRGGKPYDFFFHEHVKNNKHVSERKFPLKFSFFDVINTKEIMKNGEFFTMLELAEGSALFIHAGIIGFMHKNVVYKLCKIEIPGYKKSKDGGISFSNSAEFEVNVYGHMFANLSKETPVT